MFAGLLVWVISRCEHSLGPPLRSYCPSNAEAWDKLLDPGLDKSSGISAFSPGLLLLVLWLFFFLFGGWKETVMQLLSSVYAATSVIATTP